MQKYRRPTHRRARGTSLIEVMVAALLLAIGLLSMAGLQASALRLTKEAEFRGAAAELSEVFSEFARANVTGAMVGNYDFTNGNTYSSNPAVVTVPTTCQSVAITCTPAQIAAEDMARMREMARMRLPGGMVYSQAAPAGASIQQNSLIDLWIIWLPPDTSDGDAQIDGQLTQNCPPNLNTNGQRVQCMPFRILL